ncbi:MAG: hypothetical protein FD174_1667 [Geobacteraceae bacterium]|nr:MAG: hypothetical protein FD174_1667 [Geobacteraceae bacterium]
MFPDSSFVRIVLSAAMLVVLCRSHVRGEELKLQPNVTLQQEFNDNVFLATADKKADLISTVTPKLDLTARSEIGEGSLTAGFNWLKYIDNSSLDAIDYFVQGNGGYWVSPRLSITGAAGYSRNSRPDTINAETGLAINSGSVRQNYQLSGTYACSEKTTTTLSYAYGRENYDSSRFLDTTTHFASTGIEHDISLYLPETKVRTTINYTRDETTPSNVENYSATVGASNKLNEKWSISLNAGGRYTHSEFDVAQTSLAIARGNKDSLGWVGDLALSYNGLYTNAALSFKRDVTPASGRAGATERTGVGANLGLRFTNDFSGYFSIGYSLNKANQDEFSVQTIDERSLNVNGMLRYVLTGNAAIEAGYSYAAIDFVQGNARAEKNIVSIRLLMAFPFRKDSGRLTADTGPYTIP